MHPRWLSISNISHFYLSRHKKIPPVSDCDFDFEVLKHCKHLSHTEIIVLCPHQAKCVYGHCRTAHHDHHHSNVSRPAPEAPTCSANPAASSVWNRNPTETLTRGVGTAGKVSGVCLECLRTHTRRHTGQMGRHRETNTSATQQHGQIMR